jgi:threonine aldolase
MVARLADDHANARRLAQGLAEIPGIRIAPEAVQTNILFFDTLGEDGQPQNEAFTRAAAAQGVLFSGGDLGGIRAVTHNGISAADIDHTLQVAHSAAQHATLAVRR